MSFGAGYTAFVTWSLFGNITAVWYVSVNTDGNSREACSSLMVNPSKSKYSNNRNSVRVGWQNLWGLNARDETLSVVWKKLHWQFANPIGTGWRLLLQKLPKDCVSKDYSKNPMGCEGPYSSFNVITSTFSSWFSFKFVRLYCWHTGRIVD